MHCKNGSISSILFLTLAITLTAWSPTGSCSALQSANDGKTTTDKSNGALSAPLPHSASDILELAISTNGVAASPDRPWHITISYDQFDEDGDNVHSGTIEEFHVGPKKYKRIYASDTLNRVDIANDAGLFRTGDPSWPNFVEADVLSAVLSPLHLTQAGKNKRPEKTDMKLGNSKFPCVTFHNREGDMITQGGPVFCFEPGTAMIRFIQGNLSQEITYDNVVLFQERYLARDITIKHIDKPFIKIHVDELGEITKVSDAFFASPQDAKGPLGGRIPAPSSSYYDEYQISKPLPAFPRGIDGTVQVKYVVGKDGSVIEATANGDPESLRKAVLETVHKYRFRPYLVLDEPVEVECSLNFSARTR